MMTGMSRFALVLVALSVVACRRMEPMDLHGPSSGGESMAEPEAATAGAGEEGPAAAPSQAKGSGADVPSMKPTRTPRAPAAAKDAEPGRLAGITAAHNETRSELGLPALVWDAEVARFAQVWADKLKRRNCDLQHRPRKGADAQKYGENIFGAAGKQSSAAEVVGEWVAEVKDYDAKTNKCRGVCGHYTQVVWRKSQRLGCGMATCGDAEVWVCNYDPPGNFLGQRPY
jgi:pathogenesis-related protein 1